MPATREVKCTNDACELDMFELHYTYNMPDSIDITYFQCPYCRLTESLEEIVV
jgi:hypothetical protein